MPDADGGRLAPVLGRLRLGPRRMLSLRLMAPPRRWRGASDGVDAPRKGKYSDLQVLAGHSGPWEPGIFFVGPHQQQQRWPTTTAPTQLKQRQQLQEHRQTQ